MVEDEINGSVGSIKTPGHSRRFSRWGSIGRWEEGVILSAANASTCHTCCMHQLMGLAKLQAAMVSSWQHFNRQAVGVKLEAPRRLQSSGPIRSGNLYHEQEVSECSIFSLLAV